MANIYDVAWKLTTIVVFFGCFSEVYSGDSDYNVIHNDGSFEFGGDSPDSYHYAVANRNNVVKGEFGSRSPKTGGIDRTVYTAGPRGFRPRGKNIVRNFDLSQSGPRPIGSRDDPYYDPNEDPSYHFGFKTRTQTREEDANRLGDVTGKYSFIDDVGEKHNVEYIAGRRTGFHVKTPFPDSNPRAYGPLYFRGRGRPIPRGRTSIQRGLDGSYKFVSAGPDQRRTETSDATGHVRGSYTYLDEKGVQHSVHYIAGPETGYRVLKNVKGPHLPTIFPFGRPDIISPDFYDDFNKDVGDIFAPGAATGGSGSSRPGASESGTSGSSFGGGVDADNDYNKFDNSKPPIPGTSNGDSSYDDDYDLFGDGAKTKPGGSSTTKRPDTGGNYKPNTGLYPGSTTTGPKDYVGSSTTAGYDGVSTTPSYGGSGITPGYGEGSSTPGYGGGPTSSFPSGTSGGSYPGDTGRPEKPLSEYGPPGFGKPITKPGGSRPSSRPGGGFDYNDLEDDFGLFGSPSEHGAKPLKPPSKPSGGAPSIQIAAGGLNSDGTLCEKCKGTIVTNLGDKIFTVPPGVSVRAHVQTIDLVPYESKIPSPSDQMRADTRNNLRREELNAEEDTVVRRKGKSESLKETTTSIMEPTESTTPINS